jgi:hypothetical protein
MFLPGEPEVCVFNIAEYRGPIGASAVLPRQRKISRIIFPNKTRKTTTLKAFAKYCMKKHEV